MTQMEEIDNPNYDWNAWNDLATVEENLKELYSLINLMWCDEKEDDGTQTRLSALMTFTDMIRDRVEDVSKMIGPKAVKAA
jgi:hypothetical protein